MFNGDPEFSHTELGDWFKLNNKKNHDEKMHHKQKDKDGIKKSLIFCHRVQRQYGFRIFPYLPKKSGSYFSVFFRIFP